MKKFQFTTSRSGHDRKIIVEIYPDRQKFIQAVMKAHKAEEIDMGPVWYSEAVATTTGQTRITVEPGKKDIKEARVIIRFSEGSITTGTIAHEAAHAAVFLYQTDFQRTIPDMEREEKLCYLVGDIAEQMQRRVLAKSLKIIV